MSKYLITGATGNLGGAILKQVLASGVAPSEVSVMVRQVEKADKLRHLGVNIVEGNYFSYESMIEAFKNTERLLVIGAPSLTGRELQHDNILKAIRGSELRRVVYVGFIRPDKPRVNMTEVTDVEIKSEHELIASGVQYTILRNPLYSEALIAMLTKSCRETGILAGEESGKTATATTAELAEAAAKVLIEDGHENKIYRLAAGQNFTLKQLSDLISDALKENLKYVPSNREQYIESKVKAGESEGAASYTWEFIDSISKGDYEENSDDLQKLLGRKAENIAETISRLLPGLLAKI